MPGADDLTLLTDAAREAGAILGNHFRRGVKAWDKPDAAGPVTEADLAANAALHARLTAARPDYGWLSEEGPEDPGRRTAKRAFVIDPLDGTRAFIEGDKSWSLALAIVEAGQVMAAVTYLPMRDRLYAAARGKGATLNGRALSVSPREAVEGATVLSSRRNFEPWHWRDAQVPDMHRKFRSSMAYRLCLVAEGRCDAMLRLRPTREWDIASGCLLVEEAGGRITDRKGTPLAFNRADPLVNGLIAGAPGLHSGLLSRLA
ncbi:MAG: 3'(2'),5'-bisphosphate nucleotidase CysQ [Rhodobacterales bacterium]|nr:MAG: 3'(2'),5'-bisphosphate nucleotidase CysQ [Rhodobacterales bacterium]